MLLKFLKIIFHGVAEIIFKFITKSKEQKVISSSISVEKACSLAQLNYILKYTFNHKRKFIKPKFLLVLTPINL